MRASRRVTAMVAGAAILGACGPDARDASPTGGAGLPSSAVVTPPAESLPPPTAADTVAERARLEAAAGELSALFARVPTLTPREVAELRQDVNATQIEAARRLGTRVVSDDRRGELVRAGRLVALEDSTAWWIVRRMENAAPYLTPDADAMLRELGRRFHARLGAAGLPPYRFRITSAIRTDADQAALRRTNSYASRIVSAHEFGTTVDVSHERFAVPAEPVLGGERIPELEVALLEEVGVEHARVLQAELGRAIQELRGEGALHVMMENQQPVYHMTVARRMADTR